MKNIKRGYIIIVVVLAVLLLFLISYLSFIATLDTDTIFSQSIQIFIGFAAILSAIIALAISDKKDKPINFSLYSYALSRDNIKEHRKSDLVEALKKNFEKFPDIFQSHQVYFKITNKSGFTLKKPTITLRVPQKYMHPNDNGNGLDIRSNLFNSLLTNQILKFADTIVLSNSNLNYLNDNEMIKIWIQVCLPIDDNKEVKFRVALNADNAGGKTFNVKCNKSELLSASENKPIVGFDKES